MKKELAKILKSFCLELPIYGGLMGAYIYFVLHFLGGWLAGLFQSDRKLYAAVALGLIIAQGWLLELVARALLVFIKDGRKT